MQRNSWMRHGGWLVAVAVTLVAVASARAEGPPDLPRLNVVQPEPVKLSDHWLGLACYPVQDALRAQLNLPEDQGLVVGQVLPEGPAAEAGIEKHDVLVKADDKPLAKLQDLIDAVDAAKDQELTLDLLRGGKPMQVKVKPAERPEAQIPLVEPKGFEDPYWDRMRKYLEQFRPGEEGKPPWRLRFWGPGAILPPDAKPQPPLPGNMSVTITRSGDEPAKIVVKKDDETWEVTEDELDKLPAEVRPHVERMLGRIPGGAEGKPWLPGGKPWTWSYDFDFVPEWSVPHWEGRPEGRLEKRLEEMNRRMEELRNSIEELREKRPRLKAPVPQLKEAPPDKEEAPEKKEEKV